VAQFEQIECAHQKVILLGIKSHTRNGILLCGTGKEISSLGIPDLKAKVLASGGYNIGLRGPAEGKHQAIMGTPLERLIKIIYKYIFFLK